MFLFFAHPKGTDSRRVAKGSSHTACGICVARSTKQNTAKKRNGQQKAIPSSISLKEIFNKNRGCQPRVRTSESHSRRTSPPQVFGSCDFLLCRTPLQKAIINFFLFANRFRCTIKRETPLIVVFPYICKLSFYAGLFCDVFVLCLFSQ